MFFETIDQNVLEFLVSQRREFLTIFFLLATYLGNIVFVSIFSSLLIAYLYIKRRTQYILPLLFSVLGSTLTMFVIKNIFDRDRPGSIGFYLETGYSFPSGHATIAMSLYGFLFYLIYKKNKSGVQKFLSLSILTFFILVIGLSRLYLGVHYLSDVVFGYVLGFIWILIALGVSKSKIWRPRDNERL